jgi:hypothetical protein
MATGGVSDAKENFGGGLKSIWYDNDSSMASFRSLQIAGIFCEGQVTRLSAVCRSAFALVLINV